MSLSLYPKYRDFQATMPLSLKIKFEYCVLGINPLFIENSNYMYLQSNKYQRFTTKKMGLM